jgi:aminoglycoside N3'-acetyltransferase|tara:strand:+ start:2715 stop:3458 length:744 start_codon:yes stop_codon:yes gene_type:complete
LSSHFIKPSADRIKTLESHILLLLELFDDSWVWLPAFNYQFPVSKNFDLNMDKCELGPLPEYFRINYAEWRTLDPIFSATGLGVHPGPLKPQKEMEAFGNDSIFSKLYEKKGLLFFYGVGFSVATIIHHVESLVNPLYRYDKFFDGTIIINRQKHKVRYKYHVRPNSIYFDYCWDNISNDLENLSILVCNESKTATLVLVEPMVDYLKTRVLEDPYYLLDEKTKKWVIPRVEAIGRRFQIDDFEDSE